MTTQTHVLNHCAYTQCVTSASGSRVPSQLKFLFLSYIHVDRIPLASRENLNMVVVNKEDIHPVYEEVRDDNNDTNW